MKITKRIVFFALSVFISATYSGCKKNDRDEDIETTSSRDNAIAENAFAGIFKSIGEFTDSTSLLRIAGCASFTVDSVGTASWPKTLTIDFGPTNCTGADGNARRGKIIASFTGRYRDSLTVISISLLGYYHNNNLVQVGTHTITNNGHNAAGNLSYTVNVQNASITSTGGTITWNSMRTREWIAGESTTTNPMDDVYSIVGSASGTGLNGNGFNVTIYNPLIVALNCPFIQKGALVLSPINLSSRYVDFGNGDCDNAATVSINGVVYNISL
jgi:hypothetical protein